jgi:hypothetical protein
MAYVINLTDGTTFATIADGTVNTSSSMILVGKNYAGYGEFLDENFIHLLENSASTTSPSAPLIGQLWWDKSANLLKVNYNGNPSTGWKTISAATASASAPSANVTGDLWYDTVNQQLKVWTGSSFIVVGPAFTSATGTAGAVPEAIPNSGGGPDIDVTSLYVAGVRTAIVSDTAEFVPSAPTSTTFPRIYPGLNLNKGISDAGFAGNIFNQGNLRLGASGNAAVVIVTGTGANVTGYVTATANVTGANIITAGFASATGNITGGNISTTGLLTAAGNVIGGNIKSAAAISAVGLITAGGNVTGANIATNGIVTAAGNITGGNILTSGQLSAGGAVNATGNITGGNIITGGGVTATGTITASGNIVAGSGRFFLGDGGLLSNVSAAISVTRIENGTSNVAVGTSGGNVTIGVAGTANVVVISTTGVTTNGLTVPSITKSGSNAVGNIGSSSNYFNQVFATATTALYADVAERFAADEVLVPGTVVELGGTQEITRSQTDLSENVFGVISTRPAYTMNGGAGDDDTHPKVAMTGRVPVLVTGVVKKGDRLVSAGNGIARAAKPGEATAFNTIGRSLVDKTTPESGTIEAIVTIK